MNKMIRYVVYTAVLLALTVVFQMIRLGAGNNIVSTLIVGSLVNLCLVIAAWYIGFWSGAVISLFSVIIAFLQGHLPSQVPQMIIAVFLGNLTIVLITWLMRNKNKYAAVVIGALAKFIVLFVLVQYAIIPLFVNVTNLKAQKAVDLLTKAFNLNFSWPQLVTALIGGLLAILILPRLKIAQKNPSNS